MLERSTKALFAGAALVASTVAYAPLAGAANETWLQLDGVKGDSRAHKGSIDFLSFSWGVSNTSAPRAGGGTAAGRANFGTISIMKMVDSSSNDLMKNVVSGQSFKSAVFSFAKSAGTAAPQTYLKITLQEAFVSSVQWSAGSETPMESVTFAFARVGWAYSPMDETGHLGTAMKGGWDVTTSQPWTAP